MMHAAAGLADCVLAADPAASVACFCPQEANAGVLDSRVEVVAYPVPQTLGVTTLPGLLTLPRVAARIRRDLIGWQPDLIHFNSGHLLLPFMVGSLARRFPVVASLHDVTPHPGERRALHGWKTDALLAVSRRVMVHGNALREQALRQWNLPPERIEVCSLEMSFPRTTKFLEPSAGAPELLLFGRILTYKGYAVFAQALSRVAARVPEVRVTAAGRGNLSCIQPLLAAHGRRIRLMHRFVGDDELANIFRTASVVVLPYIEASQSGVALLAASFGRPVVATRTGAIPAIVEDEVTGRLVEPGSPEALATAIEELLTDPQRAAEMGAAARCRAESPERRKQAGHRLLEIYDAAVQGP